MSQIMHFCGVKLLAWNSGCVKFWTNIMSGKPFILQIHIVQLRNTNIFMNRYKLSNEQIQNVQQTNTNFSMNKFHQKCWPCQCQITWVMASLDVTPAPDISLRMLKSKKRLWPSYAGQKMSFGYSDAGERGQGKHLYGLYCTFLWVVFVTLRGP